MWGGLPNPGLAPHTREARLRKEVERHGPTALVHRLWRGLARFVETTDGELAKFHLTMERLEVLREVVTAHCPLDMKSLARRLSVSAATMSGLVRRLTSDGYVDQSPDPFDRRVRIVDVTPKGLFVAAAASSLLAITTARLTRALSRRDASVLLRALALVADKGEREHELELVVRAGRSASARSSAASGRADRASGEA